MNGILIRSLGLSLLPFLTGWPGVARAQFSYTPVVGQIENGVVIPVLGGGAFIGTRTPMVLAAPQVGGGPVFLQQPIFSEATVTGGTGSVVVGSAFDSSSLGRRVSGGNLSGVGIGPGGGTVPGGIVGFNQFFNNGIAANINGNRNIGRRGFLDFNVGPRPPAQPAGGGNVAGRARAGGTNLGFNVTGFGAAGGGRNLLLPNTPMVSTGFGGGFQPYYLGGTGAGVPLVMLGGPLVNGQLVFPGLGDPSTAGGPGNWIAPPPQFSSENAALPPGTLAQIKARLLAEAAEADAAKRRPADVTGWMQGLWNSAPAATLAAGLDEPARRKLYTDTQKLLFAAIAHGRPAHLPDGSKIHLVRPVSLVYTSPDGKSSTGWLAGQEMPEIFGVVAVQLIRLAQVNGTSAE